MKNQKWIDRFVDTTIPVDSSGVYRCQLYRYGDLLEKGFRCFYPDILEADKYDCDKFEEYIKEKG